MSERTDGAGTARPEGAEDVPPRGRDDAALMRRHVEGDPDAFGELFTRHRDRLWAVALRTTGDPEEAADALQDALVSAFRRAETFRGDAAVTTWLHRIVVNACLDRLRRRRARPTDPLPEGADDLAPEQATLPHGTTLPDPADLAVDAERRRTVLAALGTLSLDQRAALVLVDMEGYSVEEAAAVLGCAPGTVKSRCSRGRARLLPLLVEHRSAPPGGGAVERSHPARNRDGPLRVVRARDSTQDGTTGDTDSTVGTDGTDRDRGGGTR